MMLQHFRYTEQIFQIKINNSKGKGVLLAIKVQRAKLDFA